MRRRLLLALLVSLLGACAQTHPAPAAPRTPLPWSEQPTPPAAAINPALLLDDPQVITVEAGYVKGLRVALNERGQAHAVYQVAQEWLSDRSEAGLIVAGWTPAGDRYEQRLATMRAGLDTNSIAVADERVIVAAGIKQESSIALHLWESRDGGLTWAALSVPISGAVQADVAFLLDGRALLVATVPQSGDTAQTVLAIEHAPTSVQWDVARPFAAAHAGSVHSVWVRTADAAPSLPLALVLAGQSSGMQIARTQTGRDWARTTIASVSPWTPSITASGTTLLLTYHQYGHTGLWVARSDDGGDHWQTAALWAGEHDWNLENAVLIPVPESSMLALLAARADLVAVRRQLVLLIVPLDQVLDERAYAPDWMTAAAWLPLPLGAGATDQLRPTIARHGGQVLVAWERWALPRTSLDAGAIFAARSQPLWTMLHAAALPAAYAQLGGTP